MRVYYRFGILLLMCLCNLKYTQAQSPDWLWANRYGHRDNDAATDITPDSAGNVITVGWFRDTVDFDSGPGTFILIDAGGNDICVVKNDNAGNFIWAKSIGGADYEQANAVETDLNGNIYVAGSFRDVVDFNPDTSAVYNLGVPGVYSMFLLKLDAAGNFVWAVASTGPGGSGAADVELDASSHLVVSGWLTGTVDFDNDTTTLNAVISATYQGAYIARYDTAGTFKWVRAISNTYYALSDVEVDAANDIIVTGAFFNTIDFDPADTIVYNLTANSIDMYVLKLSDQGDFIYVKQVGGALDQRGYGVTCDAMNNIYLTGVFNGNVDFNPSPSFSFILNTTCPWTMFLLKLDAQGNFNWAKRIGGGTNDFVFCYGIDADPAGTVNVTGSFDGLVDFNPDPGITDTIKSYYGSSDIFFAGYDYNGNFLFVKRQGGVGDESGLSLESDGNGQLFVCGEYVSAMYFGPFWLTNQGDPNNPFFEPTDAFWGVLNNVPVGMENNITANQQWNLFPNPASAYFTISPSAPDGSGLYNENRPRLSTMTITNMTGQIIRKETSDNTNKLTVSVRDLEAGVYLVKVEGASFVEVRRLVVVK